MCDDCDCDCDCGNCDCDCDCVDCCLFFCCLACEDSDYNNTTKSTNAQSSASAAVITSQPKTLLPPAVPGGLVPCLHCGRMFGSQSIKIHEPQCLRKIHNEKQAKEAAAAAEQQQQRPTSTNRKPPMFPCYLCGRMFGVTSIYIHEPQCLKKWTAENEKLPPERRRQVPQKPEIKFTPDGQIDYGVTEDANWQSHLDQLVACQHCKRTFNPDRVEVHERSCKGPTN